MRRPRRQLRTAGFSVANEGDPILHHGRTDFPALLGILDRLRILVSSTPGRTISSTASRSRGVVRHVLVAESVLGGYGLANGPKGVSDTLAMHCSRATRASLGWYIGPLKHHTDCPAHTMSSASLRENQRRPRWQLHHSTAGLPIRRLPIRSTRESVPVYLAQKHLPEQPLPSGHR